MNEKFINENFAQMAAASMWLHFSALGYHCNLMYGGRKKSIIIIVILHDELFLEIPGRYCYTSKVVRRFEDDEKRPAFTTITFTFEY